MSAVLRAFLPAMIPFAFRVPASSRVHRIRLIRLQRAGVGFRFRPRKFYTSVLADELTAKLGWGWTPSSPAAR